MYRIIHEVSHEWERRTTLRAYRDGRVSREELCDADFLLKAAGRHHGTDASRPCPICEASDPGLREVLWVYGENLGRRSGSARSTEEIDDFVAEVGSITVHKVEVCGACGWNHILSTGEAVPVR